MKLTTKVHEWVAQHFAFIPYPDIRPRFNQRTTFRPLAWKNLSNKQRAWTVFTIFWTLILLTSLIGNLLP